MLSEVYGGRDTSDSINKVSNCTTRPTTSSWCTSNQQVQHDQVSRVTQKETKKPERKFLTDLNTRQGEVNRSHSIPDTRGGGVEPELVHIITSLFINPLQFLVHHYITKILMNKNNTASLNKMQLLFQKKYKTHDVKWVDFQPTPAQGLNGVTPRRISGSAEHFCESCKHIS